MTDKISANQYAPLVNGEIFQEFMGENAMYGIKRVVSFGADIAKDSPAHKALERMTHVVETILNMPKVYETEEIPMDKKTAVLRYHIPDTAMGTYIIERDYLKTETGGGAGQIQAWGVSDLGYGLEAGYINIRELMENGFVLDLDFEPTPLGKIREAKEKVKEPQQVEYFSNDWS